MESELRISGGRKPRPLVVSNLMSAQGGPWIGNEQPAFSHGRGLPQALDVQENTVEIKQFIESSLSNDLLR